MSWRFSCLLLIDWVIFKALCSLCPSCRPCSVMIQGWSQDFPFCLKPRVKSKNEQCEISGVTRRRNWRRSAAMPMCSHWLACSPDTSASRAVAMGNQAAASCRPVCLHCEPQSWSPLSFSFLPAVHQAPVHQSGDQGCERRAREEQTGARANSERAHPRAQVQVSPPQITKQRP